MKNKHFRCWTLRYIFVKLHQQLIVEAYLTEMTSQFTHNAQLTGDQWQFLMTASDVSSIKTLLPLHVKALIKATEIMELKTTEAE